MRPHATAVAVTGVASRAEALALAPGLRILDVRSTEAFAHGHLPLAGHCPPEAFALRRMELPARNVPVLTVHDDPRLAFEAAEQLAPLGFERVLWLDRALAQEPTGHADRSPAARLWSPSRFLERVTPQLRVGRALDLASGSGRAAVHLALAGFTVEAWDVDATALTLAEAFASRHGARITTRVCDLETGTLAVPEPGFDVIVVIRYLHRPLFPWIERALAPGGALVYETFRRGQEQFGHPRRDRHLLEPGELCNAFPGLRIEVHEEDAPGTPPVMARLLAHRPSEPR
ncbi:MAG: methyltransferase domain-containing protein [Candidatus Eisenbacteria bacterium]|nr:methyltransferase domain-containing protein [Candidatus Eisenbacteria bacterium]